MKRYGNCPPLLCQCGVQDDNTFNLSVGSGRPLVVGATVNQLQAVPGRGDPNTFDIDFVSGGSAKHHQQYQYV